MTPDQIKQARQSLGLTQTQIAPLLGYGSQSRVTDIETGKRNASASVIRLLTAYLDGYRPMDWPT